MKEMKETRQRVELAFWAIGAAVALVYTYLI